MQIAKTGQRAAHSAYRLNLHLMHKLVLHCISSVFQVRWKVVLLQILFVLYLPVGKN